MSVLPSFCITNLKLIFYVRQMTVIRKLMQDLQGNIQSKCSKFEESLKIFSATEKHLSILTGLFLMSLISCIIFYCAIPFSIAMYRIHFGQDDFTNTMSVAFPFDTAYHPLFEILFFISACSVGFMAMGMISMDTLFVGLVIFTRAHFSDLIACVQRAARVESKQEQRVHQVICECVAYHKRILDYVDRVQQAMSATVFVQYVGSTLLLCMIIFQTTISNRIGNLPVYVSFLSGCITQLFMYSFYGTLLTDEGQNVAQVIYSEFNWYEFSPRNRKYLLIFLLRTQHPPKLTALKIFDCSLNTFVMVSNWILIYLKPH